MVRIRHHTDLELKKGIKEITKDGICQFVYKGRKCKRPATSLIRQKGVCSIHFNALKKDNLKRIQLEMEIPLTCEFIKERSKAQERYL